MRPLKEVPGVRPFPHLEDETIPAQPAQLIFFTAPKGIEVE